jgi:Cytochrome P460
MKAITAVCIGLAGISAMVAVVAHGQMDMNGASNGPKVEAVVDAHGNLHVPASYRTAFQFLGSWAVAADEGPGSKQLHVVYASPGTVTAYRKDGRFPDGTVLVKEVYQTSTGQMTTGTVSRADTLKGWFVMMKDSSGRYASSRLWGDGWVWSWFDAANPAKTTSTDYKVDCRSCHIPAQASDWVYVGGYPEMKQ